jgi:hypothetical protein
MSVTGRAGAAMSAVTSWATGDEKGGMRAASARGGPEKHTAEVTVEAALCRSLSSQ